MSNTRTNPGRSTAPEEVLGKAYDAKLMVRVWRYVKPHWLLLLAAFAIMPVTVGFELAQPYILKIAIDDHIAAGSNDGLGVLALLFIGLVALESLSSFAQLYLLSLLGQRSMRDLRINLYSHVLGQRAAFFDRMPVGRLLTRMTSDVEAINEMFAAGVVTLAADIIKLIAIVVMMFSLNAELAAVTLWCLPLLLIVVEYARRIMRSSFRLIRVKLAAMNTFLAEHLNGVKVVQLFTRERVAAREFNSINRDHRDAYLWAIRADVSLYALVEAIGVVAVASVAYYAGNRVGQGALTVGLIVAFIEYINKFFIPVRDLSAKYTVMQSAMAATERIMTLLDTHEPDAPLVAASPHLPAAATAMSTSALDDDTPTIEFRNVDFGYRHADPVLRQVSLRIARGQTVAVVGPTGSGKSTLIKLLTRLYEPTSGDINIDGRPLSTVPADAIRKRVTIVSQDVFLFAGTVYDNILLGSPTLSRKDVDVALARVGADTMLAKRHTNADELVAERGTNFSAGEKQLIAFARALARDPEILVLDEATAHVDPEAESLIERGLAELMKGRTSLVIAHRLSTVRRADVIAVVVRGQIVELGTHDELVALDGTYAALEGTVLR